MVWEVWARKRSRGGRTNLVCFLTHGPLLQRLHAFFFELVVLVKHLCPVFVFVFALAFVFAFAFVFVFVFVFVFLLGFDILLWVVILISA